MVKIVKKAKIVENVDMLCYLNLINGGKKWGN